MKSRTGAALAGCAVFLLKLTVALQLDAHPLLQPDTGLDTTAYAELAKRVAAGDLALGPGLYYVSPLYIYFLALVYAIAKSFTAARVVQAALGTAAVVLIFLTAREWFGRRAAWIAGALAALTGIFTWYEGLILQSALDVPLTALALWLLAKRRLFPAGLVFGLAALNRPNMLLAAVIVAISECAGGSRRFESGGFAAALRRGALLIAGVLAGVAPVTLRNVVVAKQWSLISSHGGINVYIGNGPGATGYFHAVPGMRSTVQGLAEDARRVAETAMRRRLTDGEVSAYYTSLAWEWVRAHPAAWLRLMLRKAYAMLNAAHASTPFSYTFYAYDAGTLLRFCFVGPWLLVPLGIFGLMFARPSPALIAFVLAYALSVVLFFVTERYKLPMFVPLAIGAGAGADLLIRKFNVRHAAILAALFVAVNWPLRLDDGRSEERLRMAEHHAGRGEETEAERWTSLALEGPIDPGAVHFRVGAQYVNARLAAPAIAHLERAPRTPQSEYLLGRALLGSGRAAEAVPHLRRGVEAAPLAGYDLAVALQQTGDLDGAADALRAVKPPADIEALIQIGKRAGEINAPDLAESYFRRAVAIEPNSPRPHHLLGLALLVQRRCAEATAEFNTTLRLDPQNQDARAALEATISVCP
jgi:Flp pilus assembly protein TadD/4-amino-4-deoxy-L-arabinose transferase-like glycosyltransferase